MYVGGLGCGDCGGECGLGLSLSTPNATPWGTVTPMRLPVPTIPRTTTTVAPKPSINLTSLIRPVLPILLAPKPAIPVQLAPSAMPVLKPAPSAVPVTPVPGFQPSVNMASGAPSQPLFTTASGTEVHQLAAQAGGLNPWLLVAAGAALLFLANRKR